MDLAFETVDVFTTTRFGGNPLAVLPRAEGLSGDQMQKIAAEFNLAETTFVLPPGDPANTAHVRIFTPKAELPFAGHPNVGTAFVLARHGQAYDRPAGPVLRFEEAAGIVEVETFAENGQTTGARLKSPQPLEIGAPLPVDGIAAACGLTGDDIEQARHQPCTASVGLPIVMAELSTRATLTAAAPQTDAFRAHVPVELATGILLYVHADDGTAQIQARLFAPLHGIPEDPATGSANVALIGLLAALDAAEDLTLEKTIVQGVDMGRPSLLSATARKTAGAVTDTWIGGGCVPVMQGTIALN
jgi:trans-2,3-dihydro-3-hydroxyanthranilate isomerase